MEAELGAEVEGEEDVAVGTGMGVEIEKGEV